jgi:hypothetical protein
MALWPIWRSNSVDVSFSHSASQVKFGSISTDFWEAPGSNLSQVTTGKQCKSSALALRQRVVKRRDRLILMFSHYRMETSARIKTLSYIRIISYSSGSFKERRDLFVSFFMSLQSDHFASFNIGASAASLQNWVKTVQIFICPCVL